MTRWLRSRTPIDPADVAQERLIAEWLGEDPEAAARAFITQERRYYDILASSPIGSHPTRLANAPLTIYRQRRSPEGIEHRRAYSRAYWAQNGHKYAGRKINRSEESKARRAAYNREWRRRQKLLREEAA